ncbi:hypothetical protein [Pararhizobium qamdonense]|uniref:hypothetical protein n=1 Tax=Pararhizobium qamdonense TaxID=3031126 RepID=UPI0023E101AF|nr:hypothetical protein [Pararhizobium qamdonense]
MKKIDDLIASVTSIHDRYKAGRMERETVREWVLGLGGYPAPYAQPLTDAAAWFRPLRDMEPDAMKATDLEKLKAVADATAQAAPAGLSVGRLR